MTQKILSGEKYLRTLLDAYPSPVLVMNREMVVQDANQAAMDFIGDPAKVILLKFCTFLGP
jgi:PAS domain-containing protein